MRRPPLSTFRGVTLTRCFVQTFVLLIAFGVGGATAAELPVLTNIEVVRNDDEVKIITYLEGGTPSATQIRFTDRGRVMIFEVAGVRNGMKRRNISVRDDRLRLITVEELPGGVRINLETGETREPFAGHVLEPVIVPRGLSLTIWRAGATTLPPVPAAGLPYDVTEFVLEYANPHPDNIPLSEILGTSVVLARTQSGFSGDLETEARVRFPLSAVPEPNRFVPSGIRAVTEAIVRAFNDRGLAGVYVEPHPEDIDPESSRDRRRGRKVLRLKIWTGRLLEYRTFASGTRVDPDESIDNPVHDRIKSASPVQPGDLLTKTKIDEYVDRLNRHPGRVIDTALSRAGEPGGAYLDYLVNDKRPWSAYAQISNTGNKGTGTLRERFGFTHNQLTNRDDILQLDYITGNFDQVHAFFGSYDAPLIWDNRVRATLNGSYVEYDSRQLGQTVRFEGDQWVFGGEVRGTVWQRDRWFLDLFGGVRWRNITVDNDVLNFALTGDEDFFLPEIGVAVEHRTPPFSIRGEISNVWNVANIADTSTSGLQDLGTRAVDTADFEILHWNAQTSVFIDALLSNPDSPSEIPLVHEFFVSTRGQYAWGNRLAPQFQDVSTGYFAVRGYSQSITAGDDLVLGRAEYRFHLPRILPVRQTPLDLPWGGTFSVQPMQSNGLPDWDLVLRGFFDIGWTFTNDSVAADGAFNDRLMGAGVGLELRIADNIVFTADYGVALADTGNGQAETGDDQFHLLGTIAF